MSSVSVNQLSALIDFLESNRELALGYFNRSKEGRSQARRLWEQCSTVLNSVSANCLQKTPDQWRLYYNEYKSKLLKKIKMEKAEMSATGGGPSRSKKLSPLQERLYEILGRDVGEPLPGVRHNPLAVSQSHNSQALVEVVQVPLAENSQNLEEDMVVQMVDDDEGAVIVGSVQEWEIQEFEPQHQHAEVGPSMSQEANRMPEPSPPTTTHAPRQADSPAPRQTVPPAPRRRRRRVQRTPRAVNSSEHDSMHEASARLEAMEHISAEATRELAQATQRLAAAFEAVAERLREPIIIVLQNPPQAARFQQKQMQERELKIASLYEAQQARALDRVRHSPSNIGHTSPPLPPATHQPGKVRQMFEERRTKAGIDKSYPLQPIHNTDRAAARKPLPNGYSKVSNTNKLTLEKKVSKHVINNTHSVKKQQQHKIENIVNGAGDLNHNHEPDLNSVKHVRPQSNGEVILSSTDELDKTDNNYLIENETFPEAMAPTPTPRSPDPSVATKKPPPRRSPTQRTSPAKTKPQQSPIVAPQRKAATSENAVTESNKARGAMQRGGNQVLTRRPPAVSTSSVGASGTGAGPARRVGSGASAALAPAGSGVPCAVCGRRFASDRIEKHQEICRKAHVKKRKPFDVLKHRLAGTEAEPFIGKLRKAPANPQSTTKVTKPLNNNWRQKHEEFISAIRAAKQVQAHISAGGKLSDLPPPPPSENPDYVQCPHCNRRFNQSAAERHIPKCASYQYNKPKPTTKRR